MTELKSLVVVSVTKKDSIKMPSGSICSKELVVLAMGESYELIHVVGILEILTGSRVTCLDHSFFH